MTFATKIYIGGAIAAVVMIGILGGWVWSGYKTAKLEHAVDAARTEADAKTKAADEIERRSAEFAAKTAYLEQKFAEIQAIARKQDEELEKLKTNTADARNAVERARSVRSIASTADELCQRLAEVGHGCQ